MITARFCRFRTLASLVVGFALLRLVLTAGVTEADREAFRAVDPFIGTAGDGHTFPGATVPFGMVQVSPDTMHHSERSGFKWCSGYRYEELSLLGFSHTHFSGTGHGDLGDVLVVPQSGELKLEPGDPEHREKGYRSRYQHATEVAEPGYYAVTLEDSGVRAELTSTVRSGLHRYHFPAGAPAHIVVDLRSSIYDYPGKNLWSRLRVRADGTVSGYRETRGWAMGRQMYFALRFSVPPSAHALHNTNPAEQAEYKGTGSPPPGRTPAERVSIRGKRVVAAFTFDPPPGGNLLVKVALSSVGEENAIANLDAEQPGWDFEAVRAAAAESWRQALGVAHIQAEPETKRLFYTALYHSLLAPSVFSDVDGRYRGADFEVHQAKGFTFHSTFSLWDTYRAQHPWLTLVQPARRNNDFIRSLLASRRHSPEGILPVWQYHGLETWCMIGYHAVAVIADAWLKGIRDYPIDEALDAVVASATYGPYGGLDDYQRLGYVPIDREFEGASKTLEYAYDDWAIGRLARAAGRTEIAEPFERRAMNYRNVFDPGTSLMRARQSDGTFREPFDPLRAAYGGDYTEGNAWQYSWSVPHDPAGLIALMGGDASFCAKLDFLFETPADPKHFAGVNDISGLVGLYAHGNEPGHHTAYLYAYAGQPWRTQERLTEIVRTQYRPAPDGLAGNDDVGQMSAWYLFTALGFYPVAPGSGQYVIGRPFVQHATLRLPNGKRFAIKVDDFGPQHPYIGEAELNGRPLTRAYITHEEIMAGGELRFRMQSGPNKTWAVGPEARPYSASGSLRSTVSGPQP